jgi:hypothetical protein
MTGSLLRWSCRTRPRVAFWVMLTALGFAAAGVRIVTNYAEPGPYDPANHGYGDFHNGVYFPALAMLQGESPYGQTYADTYPVARQLPLYSPLIIGLHAPLALLPLRVAEVVYFAVMVACVLAIAWVLVREHPALPRSCIWPVATAIVWLRPGHVTLFNGYFTFELVLGALVALSFARTRPWVAALGFAVASGKPTYFLPLAILMAARGDRAALLRGVLLAVIGALTSTLWITGFSTTGINEFISDLRGGQAAHMKEDFESPVTSWVRLDLTAVGAKITNSSPDEVTQVALMLPLLAIPVLVLWRKRDRLQFPGATDPTGGLIVAASIMAIYHNSYDGLLLLAPLVGLFGGRWAEQPRFGKLDFLTGALLCFPLVNIFSTNAFLQRAGADPITYQILTSSNAVAIAAAAVLLSWRIGKQKGSGLFGAVGSRS